MTTISPTSAQTFTQSAAGNSAERNPAANGVIEPKSGNSFRQTVSNENASLSVEETEHIVESLNNAAQMQQRNLNFRIDDNNGRTVIKVIDSQTDDVIKQIPSEEVMTLVNHMQDMQSLLFDDEV
ncbi:MAG: flagellar protein FlaG [Oceanospirillaceae bacterium]|nr:flagellar protein FlaG [Oceanospirillaceae bacterium]